MSATTIVSPPKTTNVAVTSPTVIKVAPGGTLRFTNDSTEFPEFEIVFPGPSPAIPGATLKGTNTVQFEVAIVGIFPYKIRHIADTGDAVEAGPFVVRSCIGC